jgi:hypothetical protein
MFRCGANIRAPYIDITLIDLGIKQDADRGMFGHLMPKHIAIRACAGEGGTGFQFGQYEGCAAGGDTGAMMRCLDVGG